ncbi:hypothetical protein BDZ89DRAFT_1118275 [Hymenopellis radicata]|nr:hypothetical protein BDZ89DRAFT_1118275 [Hymenopellis radicata]
MPTFKKEYVTARLRGGRLILTEDDLEAFRGTLPPYNPTSPLFPHRTRRSEQCERWRPHLPTALHLQEAAQAPPNLHNIPTLIAYHQGTRSLKEGIVIIIAHGIECEKVVARDFEVGGGGRGGLGYT